MGSIVKKNINEEGYVFLGKIISSKTNYKKNFLRFVPLDINKPINKQDGYCLRLVESDDNTPLAKSKKINENVFDAWKWAKEDIHKEWSFFTDPKNLQPKVRKINRDIQEHLIKYHPNISDLDFKRAMGAIINPLSGKQERHLRAILKNEEFIENNKSKKLVEEIISLGIEPFKKPKIYPQIHPDLINLVCWMGIIKS